MQTQHSLLLSSWNCQCVVVAEIISMKKIASFEKEKKREVENEVSVALILFMLET